MFKSIYTFSKYRLCHSPKVTSILRLEVYQVTCSIYKLYEFVYEDDYFITLSRRQCPGNWYNSADTVLKHLSDDLPDMQVAFERPFTAFSYINWICTRTVILRYDKKCERSDLCR
jgi:hypothetical protein